MIAKLPKQNDLDHTRLYLVDNPPLPDGSTVYPVFAAYAAAVDALSMRVRFVDIMNPRPYQPKDFRDVFDRICPDSIVWCSQRMKSPLEREAIEFVVPKIEEPVFPLLDRWSAEFYLIRNAPGAQPWQLQIHCLPLGAQWFDEYVRDLKRRFPAFSNAVVFGLESCAYQDAAMDSLEDFGKPWSAFAGDVLMRRWRELQVRGCVGLTVDAEAVDREQAIAAVLAGMHMHGIGANAARVFEVPFSSFTRIAAAPAPALAQPQQKTETANA